MRSTKRLLSILTLLSCILGPFNSILAQQAKTTLQNTEFSAAEIQWSDNRTFPEDIKMNASSRLGNKEFLAALRSAFSLSEHIQFISDNEHEDSRGDRHIRYKLHYKGLELSQTQYMLHMRDGRVNHAHGWLVDLRDINLTPTLSKEEAFGFACSHMGLSEHDAKGKSKLHALLRSGSGSQKEDGRLLLSSGFSEKRAENFSLVYRFDVILSDPLERYDVDIDAHSGALVGKYPTLFHENISTSGTNSKDESVDIVVTDSLVLSEWTNPPDNWGLNEWNTYSSPGKSWWISDTASLTPGGYKDNWNEAISTNPILISGSNPRLEFVHRYNLELPDGAFEYDEQYDGWDGMNVRISVDSGNTWSVLTDPVPAYTSTSLWSFGGIHGEGPGIPGWAGNEEDWTRVRFDLSDYQGKTVMIRFQFASDGGYSSLDDNALFGWQLDNIYVKSDDGILFRNTGEPDNISSQNLNPRAGFVEGKYRLRETTRGTGIITLNARSGEGFPGYVDFVQDELPFAQEENKSGVGIHWAAEKTYDFFYETFNRNSYDDKGGTLVSYADWMEGDDQFNAFWLGDFAAYGAGDGDWAGSYGTIDVVGHEITHGVIRASAKLVYQGESGALNESFCDIFGAAIEFYAEGNEKGDWLIGEDISSVWGAFRSMKNPGEHSDPDTYEGRHWFDVGNEDDFGGVHTNSGVQNHWFYLLSEGGEGVNDDFLDYDVSGIGLNDATAIAYRNLTLYLMPDSKYHDAALYSLQSAIDLFGEDSQQHISTRDAWDAVGIYQYPRLVGSASNLLFETPAGRSDSLLVTLENEGNEPLTIYDIQVGDPGSFSIITEHTLPLELGPAQKLSLGVKFSPEMEGSYEDSLSISSSDPRDSIKIIQLLGLGLDSTTHVTDPMIAPIAELLAYPNPFTDQLRIGIKLPGSEYVTLEILDITGRMVYSSSWNALPEETHEIEWNDIQQGAGHSGSGLYLIKLRTGNQLLTTKVIRK